MNAPTFAAIGGLLLSIVTQQGTPPRDRAITPTVGTASISGVVVTEGEHPQPVRRAIVTLSGPELTPARGAITDDDGRFAIARLPAGRFTLTVTRAAFITSVYGARRPGRPGTPIAVRDGEAVAGVTVIVWRGAAVAGVVRDDAGMPVPGVTVTVIPARAATSSLLTLTNNGVTTNEAGEYRIFGLEPGTYAVAATPASTAGPLTAMSDAEVDAALEAIRRRATSAAGSTPVVTDAPSQPPFAFAPIYFPGTPMLAQATAVTLAAGQEVTGLEFSLQRVTTARVSGVVTRPDGQPGAGSAIQLNAVRAPGAFVAAAPPSLDATARADGTFAIAGVTPGDYTLTVRAPVAAGMPPPPSIGTGTFGLTPPVALWGQTDLSVTGAGVTDINLTVAPGASVAGRLSFVSDTLEPPADLARFRVWLMPASQLNLKPGTPIRSLVFSPPVSVKPDGTFVLGNIGPGTFRFFVDGPDIGGTGWWARSAMAGDRDLFDEDIEIRAGGSPTPVVVTFSDRHTELSGTLQTPGGQPASDVFVIAFPVDRQVGRQNRRGLRAVRPGIDGHFVIADLPPGDYLLGAVTDIDGGEWQDQALLDRLARTSIRVSIGEGEKKRQDIRIGGG